MCDKQRLNFYRLSRLLLEASTDTLRCFFEKLYLPQGDLQSFCKRNKKQIKSLYQRKVITSHQKEILKPSNKTLPLLSNLDITLLCILLTNLCHNQIGIPQNGWRGEPDDKDLSTGADILRLRKTRNKLYAHRTNAMMTDSDFLETWGKTFDVISRLSSHLDQKQQEDIQSKINEISIAQVDPATMLKMFDILFNEALFKILDRIGDPQSIHSAPEEEDGAEEADTVAEIVMGYDGIICVIKLYPELKSNMTKRGLIAIAKILLDRKMISEDEYERLQDGTKPRRCRTDMLLKKILRVDPEKTELLKCFLSQLSIHYPVMATQISQMVVTEAERKAFTQVKHYGVEERNAYSTSQNSCKMKDAEISFFERCLCDSPDLVDRINDQLLSKFLISISDHSLINKSDRMISDLFKKVQFYNLDVESVLEHVLEENMLEEWKTLRCDIPVTVSLDQVMQDNSRVMTDKEIPSPYSTLKNTVVHKETAVGDAKDDDKMTNFCRFFLLVMDPGKLTLQSFLEKQYSAKGDLQLFLKSKEGEVNILSSKHIIKQWQVDVLLQITGDVPTPKNLDISTICILLIYLCQITKPQNGWKKLPSNNDRSTGADILRLLHATENLIFYRKAGGMIVKEFNEKWYNIHGAISRLSVQLDEKEIDDIRSRIDLIREESIDQGKERKINDEIFKRLLPSKGENQEMKLCEIITMDVDEVCSGSSRTLLGWMRDAANTVMKGFATQFQSDFKVVEKRSIVIKLRVWKDLNFELLDRDFVGTNLRRLIRKGCFECKVKLSGPAHVTVYIFSPEAQGEKEEIQFHLELESTKHVKKPRVHLKSQDMKFLVEEMDPNELEHWLFDQLQIDVNKKRIMNEIVSWQDLSRCDQMEVLLDSIKRLENGFDMLAQYCKENDPYVYNKVFEKQEQLACTEESDTDKKAVWSSYHKGGGLQKLYSMQLDLDVEEQEDHKAPEVEVIYERNQLDGKEPFAVLEEGNVHGPATADVSFSVQSISGESHMSDAKPEDAPRQVPSLAFWAEQAQEELEKGQGLNISGLHTVVCFDLSDSMKHGAAWEQAGQFFTDFIEGLEKLKNIVNDEFVALTVFGQEVKVVQQLTNNYKNLLEAFRSLKLGGPTPLYGGLLMALAGVTSVSIGVVNGVKITSRIILVTDGYLTDPLLIAGSDVCDPDNRTKNQITAMQAVQNISSKSIRLDCVSVGNADLKFLMLLATSAHGKVYSYKDGGKLARRTINSCHAGHVLNIWKMMRLLGSPLGTEISLEDVMDISEFHRIASLSQEEKEEVLEIAKESLKKDDVTKSKLNLQHKLDKYHYEFDDPAVQLPPLGTRVRRGPDWNRGREDDNGPGTIIGHHKDKRQVHVEWDKNGKCDFYCYGDQGKYDVTTVNEPRVLQSKEKIATGCLVKRGKDWKWGNQDGAPGTNGVVIKVKKDGWVWVRWPDKRKNIYRFDTDGKFDLEICPVESQTAGVSIQPGHPSTPESRHETDDVSFSSQASSKTMEEGMVEHIEACTSAAVITPKGILSETTHPTTTSTILLPIATGSTFIAPTTTIMVATASTASTVATNTVVTSECTSSPVMVTSSETSTNSLVTTASSLATSTIPATTLPERTSTPLTTSTLLTSSASATSSTPASVMTSSGSINITNHDTTNEDNLDVNTPVSRVPKTSHWKMLAQKELVEAQKENTPGIHTVICVDISASMRQRSAWEQTQQFFNEFINGLEKIKEEFDINEDQVALSVFGHEVKVVQRLSKNYTQLQQAFSSLKLGGPTPMYGGLQMAFAGLAGPVKLGDSASEHIGMPMDFEEIASKLKHGSLASEYSDMFKGLEGLGKILESTTSLFSNLLTDLGAASLSIPVVNGIKLPPRIILITDGHLTDSLLSAGPDVRDSDAKAKTAVMKAVKDIAEKQICIHCVPVGDADVQFLKLVANKAGGQIISYKDGRNLARRTINTFHAGHIIEQWKTMNEIGKSFGTEVSLEDVMDMPVVPQIESLSQEDKVQVLDTVKEAIKKDLVQKDEVGELDKYHYEFDDPDVNLPPLGTRVCRGPDWDRGLQDGDGLGTITGHHKTKIQVHVEWDKNGKSDFYRYGDGKFDVKVLNEPRVLQSNELIATGCHVRRGKDWRWGNQGGKPDAVGVVIKVKDDDWVWVRWPDRSKNIYRFGADGFFDLEICDPSGSPVESQTTGATTQPRQMSPPLQHLGDPFKTLPDLQTELKKLLKKFLKHERLSSEEFFEFDDPDIKLPSLGTRVRRGPDWNRAQDDGDGPGTIIGHHEDKRQVHVEWDKNGKCDFYCYDDQDKHDVVVVHEPRVLQSNERIATGCHVKRGVDWMWGNQDGEPGAKGVVMHVKKDGCVWVRWPDKSKNVYRFGHRGHYDLEICNPDENQTAGVSTHPAQPTTSQLGHKCEDIPLSGQSHNMEIPETAEEKAGGLPPEILQMDEQGQKLFRKALEDGKVEVLNIRVMIVGQEGVGKTTLTQRIQGLEITETPATKGINVHTSCCRIDHDTKEWSAAKSEQRSSSEESLFYGIYNYVNKNKEEMKISIHQEQQRFSIIETQPLLFASSNPGENRAVSGVNVIPTNLDNDCKINDGDGMEKRNIVLDQDSPESIQNVSSKDQNVDNMLENRSEEVRCSSSKSEYNKFVEWGKSKKYSSKKFSNVTVLDFAGQFLFYTSHQVFMSGHTLYLLVTDISKPLSEIVEGGTCSRDMNENKECSIQDYVIYWMNSIYSHSMPVNGYLQSYGGTELRQEKAGEFKPILLVATHLDKISKEERDTKTTAYFKTVEDALRGRPFMHLIEGTIAIGNFGSDSQSDIGQLKTKIFEMAPKLPYWKYPVPTTWLALEEKLMEEKKRKPIIQVSEVWDLNKAGDVPINEQALEVFLRFEHNLGNILYFRTEKLKQKVILDPVWLIDGLQILHSTELSAIQTGQGVKKCPPDIAEHFENFKKTGRLTQSLIGFLWSEKEDERFRQNQDYLLGVMEEMNIIVLQVDKEKNQEKYYWVPCMIQDSAPDHVKNPGPSKKMSDYRTRTSTLCFVSRTRFIHVGVFHRLVASCLFKWLPAKEGKKYQLYRGCCMFTVSEDGCHQLLLALNDYVIQATVIRITSEANEPIPDVCIEIRKFIYTTLSDIAACICPNSEFDVYLKCDKSSINTTEGLLEFSSMREISCNCSKPTHPVMLQNELKFWEQREGKLPTKLDPIHDEGDKIRFNRISLLLVGVGTRVLRRLLNHYVVKNYRSFDEFLQNEEADIRDIPHMTKAMKDLLYPGGGTPSDRRAYDITLASALLTNILISPNDVQELNAVTGIRDDRNKYHAHASSVRMNSQDYTKHWERITQNLDILIKVCDDPDFKYDMLAEIGSIQKFGQPELNSRLMKCEEDISKLYSLVTVSV